MSLASDAGGLLTAGVGIHAVNKSLKHTAKSSKKWKKNWKANNGGRAYKEMMNSGWGKGYFGDSVGHSMARKGIKTKKR